MNITFKLKDQKHKNLFEKICTENKISGINGHRSVGGYRAFFITHFLLKVLMF